MRYTVGSWRKTALGLSDVGFKTFCWNLSSVSVAMP
jgi:hypothetical protein